MSEQKNELSFSEIMKQSKIPLTNKKIKMYDVLKSNAIIELFTTYGFSHEKGGSYNEVSFRKNNLMIFFYLTTGTEEIQVGNNIDGQYEINGGFIKRIYTVSTIDSLKKDLEKWLPYMSTLKPRMILKLKEIIEYTKPYFNEIGFDILEEYTGEFKEYMKHKSKIHYAREKIELVTFIKNDIPYCPYAAVFMITASKDFTFKSLVLPEKNRCWKYLPPEIGNAGNTCDYDYLDICINWFKKDGVNFLEQCEKIKWRESFKKELLGTSEFHLEPCGQDSDTTH